MKSETKKKIVKFIEKNGAARPTHLSRFLKISLQAIHKHLQDLLVAGDLERRGAPPFTVYVKAGTPDFGSALHWVQSAKTPKPSGEVCETRDVFVGRLHRLALFVKQGLSAKDLPLVISTAGEVGNNSFDHNLGQWRDMPGCWFEMQRTSHRLWILIADRGQGIYRSLSRAHPKITSEQIAMERAFNEMISGRSPERRGNGLKFVKNSITKLKNAGIACRSGSGEISFGIFGNECAKTLEQSGRNIQGTLTLIVWELHEDRN